MAKLAITLTAAFLLFALTTNVRAETQVSTYRLHQPTTTELDSVSRFWSLEHKLPSGDFDLDIPAAQAGLLKTLVPSATLQEKDVSASIRSSLQQFALTAREQRYHSFDEVQAWMRNIQNSYALLAKVVPYGTSRGGKALTALRLSAEPTDTAGVPQVMITAATHGDELITTEVVISLVEKLAAGFDNDARLTSILRNRVIYFVPVVNADGFVSRNRYDGNADPNRSYPWPSQPNATATPSIDALIKFFHAHDFKASLDLHAYGELTMFPWAYTRSHIEGEPFNRMDALTKTMSEQNGYTHGPIAETIYVAQGSSADYYFWKKGTAGIAVEIGESKVPSPSQFPAIFAAQEESTWRFLEGRY